MTQNTSRDHLLPELDSAFSAAVETALNAWLRMDPEGTGRLTPFVDKVIALELRGTGRTLFMLPWAGGIRVHSHFDAEADTVISGTPLGLLKMRLNPQDQRDVLAGEITIAGDVELGQKFSAMLEAVDPDWEEQVAGLTGDVTAHRLGSLVRGLTGWARDAATVLVENAADYLQQESQWSPPAETVDPFLNKVDALRADIDRLDARIKRLQETITP